MVDVRGLAAGPIVLPGSDWQHSAAKGWLAGLYYEYKARQQRDNRDRIMQPEQATGGVLAPEAFLAALGKGLRLLGLDVGTKTIGIALSDVTLMIASGVTTLFRTKFKADAEQLLALAAAQGVGGFVIGMPVNLDGRDGPRAQATRAFARNLARMTPLPILLWDERLSTQEAERMLISADASRKRRAEVIDKVAATIILQGALDRLGPMRQQTPEEVP